MRIENRLDGIVLGLTILRKYTDNPFAVNAEHDIIFAGSTDYPLSEEDLKGMKRAGWRKSTDGEWAFFV